MDSAIRKTPDFESRIYTVDYWRGEFIRLRAQLPPARKAIIQYLIEVDNSYDTKQWVSDAANVSNGRASLEKTREVCLALENYLARVDVIDVDSVFKRQKTSY